MRVLAVCGSPRKGNSEYILDRIVDLLSSRGCEVEKLLLRKMKIRMCTGCLACENRKGSCHLKDDMEKVYPLILDSDIILFAAPVYFEMISALMKNFMDRTCPVWTKIQGKRMAGIVVAEEGIGQAISNLKTYASVCSMQWAGSVTCLAKDPRDAAKNKALAGRISKLADKLCPVPGNQL